jgi:WD40 repeat protein
VDPSDTFLFSEATRQILVGGNHKLEVYPFENINNMLTMDSAKELKIVRMAIHPEGNLLAAALDNNWIYIWDIASQKEVMRLFGHVGLVTDLHFTRDGKLLISSSLDGTIRLWGIP